MVFLTAKAISTYWQVRSLFFQWNKLQERTKPMEIMATAMASNYPWVSIKN